MAIQTILLPVDPEGDAGAILRAALDLAVPLGASLKVLRVLPVPPSLHADVLLRPAAHPATTRRLAEEREAAEPALRELVAPAIEAGVPVSLQLAHGDPTDAILAAADPDRIDLIVMGTHASRGLARAALGSVASAVLRDAEVPVMTVRVGVAPDAHALSFFDVDLD